MGRIKTVQVKRTTNKLIELHEKKFGKDFGRNKKAVEELAEVRSKKLRNVIAGYACRLKRRSEEGPKRKKKVFNPRGGAPMGRGASRPSFNRR